MTDSRGDDRFVGESRRLPDGTSVHELTCIGDERGMIVELDRQSWHPDQTAQQWTLSQSGPGVLRGPHLHKQHADHLVVIEGEYLIGLVDVRRDSATPGLRSSFTLPPFHVLTIPAGVVHGFFAATKVTSLNATSHEFDPSDDLEVRFDDPDLGIQWPVTTPLLSARDRDAPDLATFLGNCAVAGLRVIDPTR
jgi:dTDP-4-dehydrorhamnose 3,5-epimerase